MVRIGLLPLDRMGHTAGAIAGGDLSHRVESTDPRTEVGRLGIALNAMLAASSGPSASARPARSRLRRFVADASHELRTPLTSIRGYAELYRMGAAREPADVEKADAADRGRGGADGGAGRGPADPARLDEVADAPHAPLDLAALVRDAVDDGARPRRAGRSPCR